MTTYEEIMAKFVEARKEQEERNKSFEELAEKAKQSAMRYYRIAARKMGEYSKMKSKHEHRINWVDNLVKPLLEEVNNRTGLDFDYADLRTYGISCECPVFTKNEERKAYLVFTPSFAHDYKVYINTGETIDRYPIGSIGELNGGNNLTEEVTSVETIIENLKRNFPKLNLK